MESNDKMKKKLTLPEEFVEKVRQYSGAEDSAKMATAGLVTEYWLETGEAITTYRKESKSRSHRWYIESVAASVGMSPSSMYNRARVGQNVILRGLHEGENANLSFGHWLALLRNVKKVDGVVPEDELYKRIEWVQKETNKFFGQVPSVRDIEKHYKQNGEKEEWELCWNNITRNAKKLKQMDGTPNLLRQALFEILRVELS